MPINGTATAIIAAPIDEVYAIASDIESCSLWQPDIKDVKVLRRNASGQATLVTTVTDVKVRTLTAEMRFCYDAPAGMTWTQRRGDLKYLEGAWAFVDLGTGGTEATYTMTVDLGRMLGAVIRGPLVGVLRGQIIETMPDRLKEFIESR